MTTSLRWLLAASLLAAGLVLVANPATANKAAPPANSGILDGAKLFSEDVLKKSRGKVDQIQKDYGKGLFIETIESAESKVAFEKLARAKYKDHQVGGVYILISKKDKARYVEVGDRTRQRAFTTANRDKLLAIMRPLFNEGKYDEGLQQAITYVDETFNSSIGKGNRESVSAPPAGKTKAPASNINPMWGWLCIGLVVILGIWLVVGLIRAFTRPSAPAGGGPGYAGAPAGGGGGGFMSSMLGGLFGAAAGMYLYDSFFRSSTPTGGGMSPPAYGGEATGPTDATSTGGGDWGGGQDDASGGGGDWGGGNDAGGAGGDWGDDAGGAGGDWGGGDAGGGGDWGGGGGGDW